METLKGYKFIKKDMQSLNGNHKWILNKWYKESNIELCKNGFHACVEPLESLRYVYGDRYFIVEARGEIIKEKDDKFVASEMRLIKELPINQIFKPFAIWCVKQCLNNCKKVYPQDKRISNCIKASEDYFDGKISLSELKLAESAAGAAGAAWAAELAAWAATSAARSAARSAAELAAELAQNQKLKESIKPFMVDIFLTSKQTKQLPKNNKFYNNIDLILIDYNKSLLKKADKLGINVIYDDIIKYHKNHKNTLLCTASNPIFNMNGGLDATIKFNFPYICKRLTKNKNQIKKDIAFIISVNNKIKPTQKIIKEAIQFVLQNSKGKTILLTGLGTGIGGMPEDIFLKILHTELNKHEALKQYDKN